MEINKVPSPKTTGESSSFLLFRREYTRRGRKSNSASQLDLLATFNFSSQYDDIRLFLLLFYANSLLSAIQHILIMAAGHGFFLFVYFYFWQKRKEKKKTQYRKKFHQPNSCGIDKKDKTKIDEDTVKRNTK